MSGRIAARLRELAIDLPPPRQPIANYIPTKVSGSLLFVAGQVPFINGKYPYVGKLGDSVSLADGQKAARLCAINVISQLNQYLAGNLDRVRSCVRLGGFVNAMPDFVEHPKVINGASDLIVEVFGDAGRHARTAVGCGSLPNNVAVEVEAIFEID
jgi:enamine deaminase RidA (YjgF/YER057c/UK114 family)